MTRVDEASEILNQAFLPLRLELSRDRLTPEAANTATSIAHECAFSHCGRFVKAHRHHFGESPSATRAKHRGPMRQ